jgi:hypothetical protein
MVRSLLPLVVLVTLFSMDVTPLQAQYLFLDTNRDGECSSSDFLYLATPDTVDVWIDTSKNQDGSPASCGTGETLTISSYEVILQSDAGTTLTSWLNSRPEFPIEEHKTLQPGVAWVGYTSSGGTTHLAPGKYLLGRGAYQRTGAGTCPYIMFAAQNPAVPSAETKFYSQCLGNQFDNFIRLGTDFTGTCGAFLICDATESTTWGHIKQIYH